MLEKIYVSEFVIYETPSEEAKGNYSLGLAVANRLNGNNLLIGTFNPGRNAERLVKVGFITFRKKFETKEEAQEYVKEVYRNYPVGSALNPKEWAWGEVDEESSLTLTNEGSVVHFVEYIAHDGLAIITKTKEQEAEQMQFKGKVIEPVKV